MRIAFTTDYYPPHTGGGVEAVVREVATRLVRGGHDVMVVTLGRKNWPHVEIVDGVLIHRFPSIRLNRVTGLELTVSLDSFRRMGSTIEGFAPDVVNAHHQFFTTTGPALAAAEKLGIPSVLTLHIAGLDDFGGWRGVASRFYEGVLARRLVARANALVAVSQAVAAATERRAGQAIEVIPNGVDLERFRPGDPTEDPVRFVFVGRLIANKGPDVALDAFRVVNRQAADTRLAFVGDGPMLPMLQRIVRANGLEDVVEFLGMRDDVAEILRQSNVFVRPSQIEGMPLTILEAMATGLPVIACDVGGVSEIVVHGTTGLIVAPGSKSSVADAMLELLMDQNRRREMGIAAQERVQGAFSWESTAAANLELFEDLVRTRHD